ncbi:hypothetical protein LMG28688_02923 [Paraburkholderia caffeinitolerans]|uniref:Calcineurin-like phosphoesterase domain-containing protein n=1 Tax=Paraburkholderia caffeinitolerans TaxID=1723730 RepID=A0A6J5FXW5_9BURK|nr:MULTISPECIES: hypothetical protein [Paraburkholderia]CAB3789603.1 hypothetical protein LMG28688_02923 [Paraburkholderia caffeinitolerans]
MSWPQRRTANAERRFTTPPRPFPHGRGVAISGRRGLPAALVCLALFGLPLAALAQDPSPSPRYSFAVVANVVTEPGDEITLQRLIDAIGRDPQLSFAVYDGNLKGPRETCTDRLYDRRRALLDASRVPLVFVPGQRDWSTCGGSGAGGYDPVERLDFLRQNFFTDTNSLGQSPLTLTRESEVSRFRPYRENTRWQLGDTVFIALNAPDGNNHYLNAGGRNGEFEDRVIANGFWLEHAAEFARRRNARAIVIFMQGNAMPEQYEHQERFAWLRFRRTPRDGYTELRRSLTKLAETFRGPVILVQPETTKLARGFTIDQPLRNEKGIRIANVTRIAFSLHDPLTQWLQIDADMARRTPLRVSVHEVPKHLPLLPPQPPTLLQGGSSEPALPEMPEISSMPDVTEIPGMQQAPDANGASGTNQGGEIAPSGRAPGGAGAGTVMPSWPSQRVAP